jgi:transposase
MTKQQKQPKIIMKTKSKAKLQFESKRNLPHLTISEREQIHLLYNTGQTPLEIAATLGCSKRTVNRSLKNIKERNTYASASRSGRPKVCSERVEKRIVTLSSTNRRLTIPELQTKIVDQFTVKPSDSTISRILRKNGLFGRPAAKKPLLSKKNIAKRLSWAKKYVDWPLARWNKVIWTDESPFKFFGTNRKQIVRRKANEEIRPDTVTKTVKHGGGGIMVWGCFAGNKIGKLHRIRGIMDQHVYHSILQHVGMPSAHQLFPRGGFVWQEDNDPKHTSRKCRDYLLRQAALKGFTLLDWPAQSPDLNPIEMLWEEMGRRIYKARPSSVEQLWEICQEVWDSFQPNDLQKLVNRMPFICKMVIHQKGGYFQESGVRKRCVNLGLVKEPELLALM